MKIVKAVWIEIIFLLLMAVVIFLSISNSVKSVSIDYGKHLEQADVALGNKSFTDYIEEIKSVDNCMAIFAIKDIPGFSLTQEDIDALQKLGFNEADDLINHEYHSFIGIWSNGEVLYQCIGGDESITYKEVMSGHNIFVRSATLHAGNAADICIDYVQYSVNGRGINIVTIDNEGFKLIDSIAYDFHAEEIPIYRLVDGVNTLIAPTREKQ